MKDFKELKVWRKAYDLTLSIYAVTRGFPKEELCGLTSQLRRSAASVGANIAEGAAADDRTEKCADSCTSLTGRRANLNITCYSHMICAY